MVVQSAEQAIANARKTTRNDVGMCLWYAQEWLRTPHVFPSASAQWRGAKRRHAGDRNPPAGAPVLWTGGGKGYGHAAISLGNGKIRSIDCTRSGVTSDTDLSWPERAWGLKYEGWTEDLGGVDIPYLVKGLAPGGPSNPNRVKVGDLALVTAQGTLNGRAAPGGAVKGSRPYGGRFTVAGLQSGWASDGDLWFSTDYLFPQVKPDPKNPNGVKVGDVVEVTASVLKARTLPGGPQSQDKSGKPLSRAQGYRFTVTKSLQDGWATGGTNWYSSDHLKPVPAATKPAWSSKPTVTLAAGDIPSPVNYLQGVVRVAPLTSTAGKVYPTAWVLAQDPDRKGHTRFLLFGSSGAYQAAMTVTKGGHGQTFHAYRSSAGNLWVWTLIGSVGYRIKWRTGTVTASSPDVIKQDYGGRRPVGTFERYIAFRSATTTRETFTLHDRHGFTDSGSVTPIKTVTIPKRTTHAQQSWSASPERIYRIMGSTNKSTPKGYRLHILDVFNWSGKLLLDRFDITAMAIPTTSDEPEGLTFSGAPGAVLAGKRAGPNSRKRSYPIWTLTGLP